MFFSATLALSALGLAQAATFDVIVGAGGLKFQPSSVAAAVGDTINFVFNVPGTNHTATLSTFGTPCVASMPGVVDSGFNAVKADDPTTFRNWSITLDKTDPLWFYCAQGKHCQNGMVFAVNPTADKTFDKFVQNAAAGGNSTAASSSGAPAASGSASASSGAPAASGSVKPSGSASASASASASSAATSGGAGNGAEVLPRSVAGVLAAVAGVAVFVL